VSCYLRHLKPLFGKVGITPETKEERKRIDLAIRTVVGKSADNPCNEVWREVKAWLQDGGKKNAIVEELKKLR
jgi:hypothetical protein